MESRSCTGGGREARRVRRRRRDDVRRRGRRRHGTDSHVGVHRLLRPHTGQRKCACGGQGLVQGAAREALHQLRRDKAETGKGGRGRRPARRMHLRAWQRPRKALRRLYAVDVARHRAARRCARHEPQAGGHGHPCVGHRDGRARPLRAVSRVRHLSRRQLARRVNDARRQQQVEESCAPAKLQHVRVACFRAEAHRRSHRETGQARTPPARALRRAGVERHDQQRRV